MFRVVTGVVKVPMLREMALGSNIVTVGCLSHTLKCVTTPA